MRDVLTVRAPEKEIPKKNKSQPSRRKKKRVTCGARPTHRKCIAIAVTYAMIAIPKGFAMPTLEATEYERFNFDESDRHALTLDDAVKKAKELRKKDSANFYRVELADEGHMSFTVTKVPMSSVYADFMARIAKALGRYVVRAKSQ